MSSSVPDRLRPVLQGRVPEATFAFWVIAILSMAVGQTLAGGLVVELGIGLGLSTWIVGGLLALALAGQFLMDRCNVWIASTVLLLVGTYAILLIDNLSVIVGATGWVTTVIFGILLAVTLTVWFLDERALSPATVCTRRREAFYWIAVLFAFALGTSGGGLVAEGLALNPLMSMALFTALIGVIAVTRSIFNANGALCFWVALVLTRPLGASIGDLLSLAPGHGGLGLGPAMTSILLLVVIICATAYSAIMLPRRRMIARAELVVGRAAGGRSAAS